MIFFYFNHFSWIIFYHSVWLGFELFGLRVQVCSQLMQLTLVRKGYDNHHCHNYPPDRKCRWSVDDVMPRRDGRRIWKILKKIQLSSDHGVEKLGSDQAVEDLRLNHAGRQLSFCHWGREWSSLLLIWVFCRCGGCKVSRVPTSEDELRSKTSWDVPNVGGIVVIY